MLGHKNKSVVVTQCPPEAEILGETNKPAEDLWHCTSSEPGEKCIFSLSFANVASKWRMRTLKSIKFFIVGKISRKKNRVFAI